MGLGKKLALSVAAARAIEAGKKRGGLLGRLAKKVGGKHATRKNRKR